MIKDLYIFEENENNEYVKDEPIYTKESECKLKCGECPLIYKPTTIPKQVYDACDTIELKDVFNAVRDVIEDKIYSCNKEDMVSKLGYFAIDIEDIVDRILFHKDIEVTYKVNGNIDAEYELVICRIINILKDLSNVKIYKHKEYALEFHALITNVIKVESSTYIVKFITSNPRKMIENLLGIVEPTNKSESKLLDKFRGDTCKYKNIFISKNNIIKNDCDAISCVNRNRCSAYVNKCAKKSSYECDNILGVGEFIGKNRINFDTHIIDICNIKLSNGDTDNVIIIQSKYLYNIEDINDTIYTIKSLCGNVISINTKRVNNIRELVTELYYNKGNRNLILYNTVLYDDIALASEIYKDFLCFLHGLNCVNPIIPKESVTQQELDNEKLFNDINRNSVYDAFGNTCDSSTECEDEPDDCCDCDELSCENNRTYGGITNMLAAEDTANELFKNIGKYLFDTQSSVECIDSAFLLFTHDEDGNIVWKTIN